MIAYFLSFANQSVTVKKSPAKTFPKKANPLPETGITEPQEGNFASFMFYFLNTAYLISTIQPSGALMVPIWIPVKVSYSFFVTGPICSIPLGRQISLP